MIKGSANDPLIGYEVFVQSFADSNGDGIGDLPGLTQNLDYLIDLGVNTLWLMPIHPSPSYHKYDVTDYYSIHPDYGSLEDFRDLVKEAQIRGFRVILDLVINHCSDQHPWFQAAHNPDSEFRDYFIWKSIEQIDHEKDWHKDKRGDSDNINVWNKLQDQQELYYSYFWKGMPDLNYDHPKVREEVYHISKYWLEMGVDGFRLDAARHIYPDERTEDTIAFWKEFKGNLELIKPDILLIGEVWTDEHTQARFAPGFSSLFNFDLSYSILETVKKEHSVSANVDKDSWKVEERDSPADIYLESQKLFKKANPHFEQSTFLTNHDQIRVKSFLKAHVRKTKLAATILLTLPGCPFIYYGEELGMKGRKPDQFIREPFLWGQQARQQTSWLQSRHNQDTRNIESQKKQRNSMFNHYKSLIELRKSNPALAFGSLTTSDLQDNQMLSYQRQSADQKLWIIHNLSGADKHVSVKDWNQLIYRSNRKSKIANESCFLPAYASAVLSKKA